MRKLRLALLGIVSIFCLNSCVTTALSTLAGVAVAVCGENGCNDLGKDKKSGFGGIIDFKFGPSFLSEALLLFARISV